jgi:Uma2 family endonuclease
MSTVAAEKLITAEEFAALPDDGGATELVRGRVVPVNMPYPRHGQVCSKVDRLVGNFADEHNLGHVVCNDSGVITERGPDTVRGADVAFFSYEDIPKGPFPQGYLEIKPRLIFEVRSAGDRWAKVLAKVVEYLDAGVSLVCVLDIVSETARVYRPDQPEQLFTAEQELTLPEALGDFRVTVSRFFE